MSPDFENFKKIDFDPSDKYKIMDQVILFLESDSDQQHLGKSDFEQTVYEVFEEWFGNDNKLDEKEKRPGWWANKFEEAYSDMLSMTPPYTYEDANGQQTIADLSTWENVKSAFRVIIEQFGGEVPTITTGSVTSQQTSVEQNNDGISSELEAIIFNLSFRDIATLFEQQESLYNEFVSIVGDESLKQRYASRISSICSMYVQSQGIRDLDGGVIAFSIGDVSLDDKMIVLDVALPGYTQTTLNVWYGSKLDQDKTTFSSQDLSNFSTVQTSFLTDGIKYLFESGGVALFDWVLDNDPDLSTNMSSYLDVVSQGEVVYPDEGLMLNVDYLEGQKQTYYTALYQHMLTCNDRTTMIAYLTNLESDSSFLGNNPAVLSKRWKDLITHFNNFVDPGDQNDPLQSKILSLQGMLNLDIKQMQQEAMDQFVSLKKDQIAGMIQQFASLLSLVFGDQWASKFYQALKTAYPQYAEIFAESVTMSSEEQGYLRDVYGNYLAALPAVQDKHDFGDFSLYNQFVQDTDNPDSYFHIPSLRTSLVTSLKEGQFADHLILGLATGRDVEECFGTVDLDFLVVQPDGSYKLADNYVESDQVLSNAEKIVDAVLAGKTGIFHPIKRHLKKKHNPDLKSDQKLINFYSGNELALAIATYCINPNALEGEGNNIDASFWSYDTILNSSLSFASPDNNHEISAGTDLLPIDDQHPNLGYTMVTVGENTLPQIEYKDMEDKNFVFDSGRENTMTIFSAQAIRTYSFEQSSTAGSLIVLKEDDGVVDMSYDDANFEDYYEAITFEDLFAKRSASKFLFNKLLDTYSEQLGKEETDRDSYFDGLSSMIYDHLSQFVVQQNASGDFNDMIENGALKPDVVVAVDNYSESTGDAQKCFTLTLDGVPAKVLEVALVESGNDYEISVATKDVP